MNKEYNKTLNVKITEKKLKIPVCSAEQRKEKVNKVIKKIL